MYRFGMSDSNSRLRTLREQRKLHQVDVAAAVGVSRATISKYETGGDIPGRDTLMKLANFFGVSMDYLAARPGETLVTDQVGAKTEDESLWLWAFRSLPEQEAKAHLALLLQRIKGQSS